MLIRKIIKVPSGICSKAKSLGYWNPLLFYYNLKLKSSDGFFKSINQIINYCGFSQSYCYKKIKQLEQLGWIKINNEGYFLAKYDKIFTDFGYSQPKKIHKIKITNIAEIESNIYYTELKYLGLRQIFKSKKAKEYNLKLKRGAKNGFLTQLTTVGNYNSPLPFSIFLSCRFVSKILGFSSSSTGFEFLKFLENKQLLFKRKGINENGFSLTYKVVFAHSPFPNKYGTNF